MLRLYWRLVWARERSNMQYRVTFWLLTAGSALFVFQDFLALVLFFEHIPTFAGSARDGARDLVRQLRTWRSQPLYGDHRVLELDRYV